MSLSFWRRLLSPSARNETAYARALYLAVVRQSRQPFFYVDCGVPDTLQGRFEVLALHLFLVLDRLRNARRTGRALLECFIDDMDRSVRELGAGDTGAGTRVQVMAKAFFGRRQAYTEALKDTAALMHALRHNVYATAKNTSDRSVDTLARYATRMTRTLEAQPANRLQFPSPAAAPEPRYGDSGYAS